MAVILPHSVFFHFPKTGGYFVRKVIQASGVPYRDDDPRDLSFHAIDPGKLKMDVDGRAKFLIMRHPMEWYTSYWNHRIQRGWEGELHVGWNAIDIYQAKGANDFPGFLEQVLDEGVPFISQHRDLFEQMDFIGRFENLREELCWIFKRTGDKIPCDLIRRMASQNVIPYSGSKEFKVPASLYRQMLELENWAFDFFEYPEVSDRFYLF